MTKLILDTDHISLILRGANYLRERAERTPNLWMTVVTFQEVFNGWTTRINQAKRLQRDMRIAAIALANDATIVTRNTKDFVQVPGLKIIDWTM